VSAPLTNQEQQRSQKSKAGKKSGSARADHAKLRRRLVEAAFRRLPVPNQRQPFSDYSIDALERECLNPKYTVDDIDLYAELLLADKEIRVKVSRETLINDLKLLGIRSRYRKQRPG
jgi:hypothetical protein